MELVGIGDGPETEWLQSGARQLLADAGRSPATAESSIGRFAQLIAKAVVAGYRNDERSPVSIEHLLDGRVADEWALSGVANHPPLPTSGRFVVVAAQVSSVGGEALPGVEAKLRSLDVYSAWRLLPDLHVGIVHLQSQQ